MKKGAVFAPLVLLFLAFSAFSQTPINNLAQMPDARFGWSASANLFQSPRSDIITLQNAAAADGNGTAFDVGTYGGVALQIAGSFTATITFEATIDRSNWIAVKADNLNDRTSATTATAAGIFQVPLSGAVQFRARISDFSGGTVTVKARGVAGQISLKQSSGGGGGGSVDSVFGRTGDVVAATNDYTWAQINKTTSSLANITTRSASDLSSGTLPDARFPATLPALNGSNLTALNASNLASGTVPLARISGLTNTEIDNAAAIAYGKLNLTGAIVNGDLAGSIANNKLANSAITIAGSSTSLGGSITASTILDSIGSTRGSVLYRGASGWAILTPGTSGQFFKTNGAGADPEWADGGGGGTAADPSASVGLSAVNGVASTYMRSDAAPALSQSIAPTWTGIHTFNNGVTTGTGASAGTAFTYNSLTTGNGAEISSSSVTSGNVVSIAATGTAAASNTKTALRVATSGANGTSTQTTYGVQISNASTGTSSTNIGAAISASGGSSNTALLLTGSLGQSGSGTFNLYGGNGDTFTFGTSNGGTQVALLSSGRAAIPSGSYYGISSTTNANGSVDIALARPGQAATWRVQGSSSTTAATFSTPALSPAQITADQNNYAPGTGWFQRWSSDASRNVTGLAAGVDGQVVEIWNVGSNNIVLQNENASSTAANRFATSTGADLTLSAGKCAKARYDNTSSRWRAYLCN